MEFFESININNIFDLGYEGNYFKEENLYIKVWLNSLVIKDLKNAMKRGKICKRYDIYYKNNNFGDDFPVNFANWLNDNCLSFKEFIILLKDGCLIEDFYNKFKAEITEEKGVRVFSPFAKVNKVKKPKKWTLSHVAKAILTGQIKKGKCDGRYTDDYAFDAAYNFQKGEISVLSLAKKIIESPSGWWVYEDKESDGVVQLSVSCYYFDLNTLYFKAN